MIDTEIIWTTNQWPADAFHAAVDRAAQTLVNNAAPYADLSRVKKYIESELLACAVPAGTA